MGLLLLLISTLLSSYFHPGRVVNAQSFTIRSISLSIEPRADVTRGTDVTLRCRAIISSMGQEALSREYSIFKDGRIVYNKTSSTSEDFLYPLPDARVSNTGKYKCSINIESRNMNSEAKKLTVTGLSKPVLHLNTSEVREGMELTARCTAPHETGSFFFYFYDNSKEISEKEVHSNQAEVNIYFGSSGIHKIHCAYIVLITPDFSRSEESNVVNVSVTELPISAVLKISPQQKIYEGDKLSISCTISDFVPGSQNVRLLLIQGTQLLKIGDTEVNHSMTALAENPGEFECQLEIGNIVKTTRETVSVTELFSVPTLTMSPAEVFQMENMTLTCKSERYAYEVLRKEELTYTLDPPQNILTPKGNGEFSGKALEYDFNYTCATQARGIVKRSKTLTVRPKVSVSKPKISVVGRAVLGKDFKILCRSDNGSLPITYTLMKDKIPMHTITIKFSNQQALFTDKINSPDDINKYTCEATNSNKNLLRSERLNTDVVEPLANAVLTVIPDLREIPEGKQLYLICGVKGTPPITFKWYREGSQQPLYTTTTMTNNTNYEFQTLSKDHSGSYYCEATNYANKVVQSESVKIQVCMALWKKAVIGGFCLLAISVLVLACVLFFRFKRGKREGAAELSVKPSSAKSDLEFEGNLTYDTKVYNTATGAAPLYDGTEGRVTNGVRDSVASLPIDISNRSSFSIPATV